MTIGFKTLAVSASLLLATSLPSFADQATESYVNTNANIALSTLNDPDLDSTERREAFQTLMNRFTDMERVSRFVLGKYANRFSDAEMDRYFDAYSRYAPRHEGDERARLHARGERKGRPRVGVAYEPLTNQPAGRLVVKYSAAH